MRGDGDGLLAPILAQKKWGQLRWICCFYPWMLASVLSVA